MTFLISRSGLIGAAVVVMAAACSSSEPSVPPPGASAGSLASGGSSGSATGSPSSAGSTTTGSSGATSTGAGAGASAGSTTAGSSGATSSGAGVSAGAGGTTGGATGSGTGSAEASGGPSGSPGSGSSSGASGSAGGATNTDAGGNYAPAPRPINVTATNVFSGSFNGQPMYFDPSKKPVQGKLVLFLGGICTGVGGGGFESFVQQYGFHTFSPKTDTCLDGGKVPGMYKTALMANPNDPEANRQIGDSRMELWDGMTRVNWYSVAPGASIVAETVAAIKYAVAGANPGGDWGYFLDATGNGLRTSDVWVVGYSWGSQTWAMISAYVPFGRVITTSGPQAEGYPNASWITQPSPNGTPGDRKYLLVGFVNPYPSGSAADSGEMGMVATVTKAGWIGPPTNVTTTSPGPYMLPEHLFAMIGGNGGTTPGGHTVFCNNNPMNGWLPLCKYVLAVQ